MVHQAIEKYNNEYNNSDAMLDVVLARLHYKGPRGRPQYMCRCPAHDDHKPSLSVTLTVEGKILIHCFAGCKIVDVLSAIGLTLSDLMPHSQPPHQPRAQPRNQPKTSSASKPAMQAESLPSPSATLPEAKKQKPGTIVTTYDYCDAGNHFVCQVVRFEPKSFRQRTRVDDKWVWSLRGLRPPLYRLPELLHAPHHDWVFIVEGEKDVETVRQQGLVATCNIQGAGKWKPEYNQWLTNRRVCILPDNDEVGRQHAQMVAQQLGGSALQVQILPLPHLPEKGDVSDWFAQGGTAQKLLALANQAASQRWLPTNHYVNTNDDSPLPYLRESKGKRNPRPTTPEYLLVLTERLHYDFANNDLDDTIEVNGSPMDNGLAAEIRCKMRDLGYRDRIAMEDAYTAYAQLKHYHPVKRYLESLAWDGKNHLDRLVDHLQDDHPPITYNSSQSAAVAKVWLLRFLVGAVARVYDHATIPAQPPMLVLDGRQGLGKSTLVRWLGSPLPLLTYEDA